MWAFLAMGGLVWFLTSRATVPASERENVRRRHEGPIATVPLPSDPWAPTRAALKATLRGAFRAYHSHAWGMDEYFPVQQRGKNTFGGKGLTIIDSLDTLYLMGLREEYEWGRAFVNASFAFTGPVNVFENTIRVLGGLLSAYTLTDDAVFLRRAEEVGRVLLRAFHPPNPVPCGTLVVEAPSSCGFQAWANGQNAVVAEVGTLSLEFKALSHLLGDTDWSDRIDALTSFWEERRSELLHMFVAFEPPHTASGKVTIGGGVDSTYEYFVKLSLLAADTRNRELYERAEDLMIAQLLVNDTHHVYFKESQVDGKFEHLSCFVGGMLLLGGRNAELGLRLTETCVNLYFANPSGLACDSVRFQRDGATQCLDDRYLLRPETVESVFYAWRHTHDPKWRTYAARIWDAIQRHCVVPSGGFTDVRGVTTETPQPTDMQESWFLAETIKYLWLTFSEDDVLSLDDYVLTTEAHPLRKFAK